MHGDELDNIIDIIDLINVLFKDGLSQNLIMTLIELSKVKNQQFRKPIQIKLLNVISLVLSGKQFSFSRNIAAIRKLSEEGKDKIGREQSIDASGSLLYESLVSKSTLGELNSIDKEIMK